MAKRKRRDEESRISQLPNPMLQHILSFLPQKEAIRTCVLSKSWRHLGPTRPNVVLHERSFSWYGRRDRKKFLSVLEKTLQTYQDQKLSLQDLHVEMKSFDSHSSSILEKSVKSVKTFALAFTDHYRQDFPPFIFEAESLEEIHLTGHVLTNELIEQKVLFKYLKTLHLKNCYIEDEIFVKIMSSCPLIEYLVLELVQNFRFNNHYPHLKSLCLRHMSLSAESFDYLSANDYFPCLEQLELLCCSGFEEFVLSSRSIKSLIISDMSCNGVIDAPNILYFEVSSTCVTPPSISLTTTSKEWKSLIDMRYSHFLSGPSLSTWFLKINELLKGLSQSQISSKLSDHYLLNDQLFMGDPAVVEHLDLSRCKSFTSYADILICFFRICRPKFLLGMCPGITAEIGRHSSASCKSKIIIKDRRRLRRIESCFFWQQDLEELSSEVWDHNAKEWHQVKLGTLSCPTLCALSDKKHIRYRLKWREEKTR